MTTHFRGRFEIKVDPKFRLILPAPFREVVKLSSDSRMVITNSQYQGKRCLDVYPFAEWKKLETRISKLPQLKVEVQNFQRFYLSGGHPVESLVNLGILHERKGDQKRALDLYRRALERGAHVPKLREWIAAKARIYGDAP